LQGPVSTVLSNNTSRSMPCFSPRSYPL
jgi:hypothetical protein